MSQFYINVPEYNLWYIAALLQTKQHLEKTIWKPTIIKYRSLKRLSDHPASLEGPESAARQEFYRELPIYIYIYIYI